ncbi:MAG: Cof-type HAD-IIB family hydrolase [Prevotellaceae bacterium]|jgi:Cof subfamily protein (haloacid dehalogenase superfamily)|nr:Cof-type HAD-IIB family hydrolase [Prevotellaceae bacterium]
MIKALFFDIDGTLVSFHTHRIPDSAVEAIAAARGRGIKIFIATGRPYAIVNNLGALQARGLVDGYITMNGGYCFVEGEVIHKGIIPSEEVHTLARLSVEHDFPCIFVEEHTLSVCRPTDEVAKVFYDFLKVDRLPTCTPDEVVDKEIFQMTPFITPEQEQRFMPLLPHCEAGRWYPTFADLTAKGNTKQHGVDLLIRRFGIRLEETMAFGDGGNDMGMLRHVSLGVAMGNASDQVKAAADYVTSEVDEDGIANALRHFGLC